MVVDADWHLDVSLDGVLGPLAGDVRPLVGTYSCKAGTQRGSYNCA